MSEVKALVECPVIVGTAGHVDHGKSALIEALTGKNPDRLEVERRRGMTVELGFGELALPSGKIVGLVDVPGHAHYLRAMVQGATGIDVAVLVVSAVEGVMPQTREHVHVLELLGVTHMVVALTMCDLADSEMTELAELDVDDFLSGTVFEGAPIVPVSSKTGAGIDNLLVALDEQVAACWDACRARAEITDAAPRLPIDRCFTIKGAGTVVTGTLHDAPVAVGDELVALPSRTVCRVRGIQVHGDTPRALPGQRVALNLVGDGVAALDRGEMLGVADRFGQTLRFMMTFTYLGREGAKPRVLESGARVHVMTGTAEVVGRIMFMEGEAPMAVGETRTVQVRLEEPLPLRAGDHAVVLSYSPVMLIGGGRVLLSRCRRSRELAEGERALYAALESGDIAGGVGAWLALQMLPVTAVDVAEALDLGVGEVDAALREQPIGQAQHDVLQIVILKHHAGERVWKAGDGEVNAAAEQRLLDRVVRAFEQRDLDIRILTLKGGDQDGAAARVGDADAQLAFLIFGDIAEFAFHGLTRLPDGFGIAQKRAACVGELKRRAAHKECAAELLFKSRNVGRERLLRDVQRFSSAGEVFLPREHEKIVKRMEIHGNAPFTAISCRIYQF